MLPQLDNLIRHAQSLAPTMTFALTFRNHDCRVVLPNAQESTLVRENYSLRSGMNCGLPPSATNEAFEPRTKFILVPHSGHAFFSLGSFDTCLPSFGIHQLLRQGRCGVDDHVSGMSLAVFADPRVDRGSIHHLQVLGVVVKSRNEAFNPRELNIMHRWRFRVPDDGPVFTSQRSCSVN